MRTSSLLLIVAEWEGLLASCLTTVMAVFILKEDMAFYISYTPLTLSCRGRGCVTVDVSGGRQNCEHVCTRDDVVIFWDTGSSWSLVLCIMPVQRNVNPGYYATLCSYPVQNSTVF